MSSPLTTLGIYSSHDVRTKMAFKVKVEYGVKRFATFLLENVSYDGLVSSIRKNCSSLAHLEADKIRLRYHDEDGNMVKARIHGETLHAILCATFFTRRGYTVATFRATLRAIFDERLPRYRFSLKL